MIIDIENYRISPYPGDTCWKIQERGEEDAKTEWKEAKYFPVTLDGALTKVRELLLKKGEDVKDLKAAIKRNEEIEAEILEAIQSTKALFPSVFK